jgi:hypothetical protein
LIISKPQKSTVLSFTLFLAITATVITMNLVVVIRGELAAWYNYAIVGILVPIGAFVLYRIFILYKIVHMGNNQIQINYPVLHREKKYAVGDIVAWRENKVTTGKTSEYRELQVLFSDKNKLSIGHKEHTEYARMVQYLSQKAGKKRTPSE